MIEKLITMLKKLAQGKVSKPIPDSATASQEAVEASSSPKINKEDITVLSQDYPQFAIIYGIKTEKPVLMIPFHELPTNTKPILKDHNGVSFSSLN